MAKEPSNDFCSSLKTAKGRQHQSLELVRTGDELLADAMILGMVPDLLDGIDLRGIWWKEVELKAPLGALNEFLDCPAAVDRMPIDNEEDWARFIVQQAFEEFDEALGIHRLFVEHEPELASGADGADDIERETRTRGANHGRFPLRRPGGARTATGTYRRFVQDIDAPLALLRLASDLRKDFRLPPGHLVGILLMGPEQGALGRKPQLTKQPRNAPAAEMNPELLVDELGDQLQGPEGEGKLPLRGLVIGQRAIEPFDGLGIELGLTPASLAGVQCIPATSPIQGQPVKQGRAGNAHAAHDIHDGHAFLHLSDCLAPELGKLLMRQSAKVCLLGHAASLV